MSELILLFIPRFIWEYQMKKIARFSLLGMATAIAMLSSVAHASVVLTLENSNVNAAILAHQNSGSILPTTISSTPNGTFTYGYFGPLTSDPNAPTVFTPFEPTEHTNSFAGSPDFKGFSEPNSEFVPAIVINANPSEETTSYGIPVQEGQLILHPGGVGASAYAPPIQSANLRFTAASTESVYISGAFSSLHSGQTDAHVFVNGISQYDTILTGNGSTGFFGINLLLNAGDIVDFRVGPASDGIGADSTGLYANIVATPEPATWVGVLTGGVLLCGLKGLRKRKVARS